MPSAQHPLTNPQTAHNHLDRPGCPLLHLSNVESPVIGENSIWHWISSTPTNRLSLLKSLLGLRLLRELFQGIVIFAEGGLYMVVKLATPDKPVADRRGLQQQVDARRWNFPTFPASATDADQGRRSPHPVASAMLLPFAVGASSWPGRRRYRCGAAAASVRPGADRRSALSRTVQRSSETHGTQRRWDLRPRDGVLPWVAGRLPGYLGLADLFSTVVRTPR